MPSWGHKIVFIIYGKGEFADDDALFKACEDLDARFDAEFIGVAVMDEDEEPKDQGGT